MVSSPGSVIARAVDAYRVRLWRKGPRCPCRCGERVPWSAVPISDVFEKKKHVPTARRPYQGMCEVERNYIPETIDAFRDYLVERRHVLRPFSEMLRQHCLYRGEAWIMAFLANGHATWLYRQARGCANQTPCMVFGLVKCGWLEAANIVLSWPTTAAAFGKDKVCLDYLVRRRCVVYHEYIEDPLTSLERAWILHHPALSDATRAVRAQKRWTFVLLWTGLVKSWMREWRKNRVPLPEPRMENVVALTVRMRTLVPLHPAAQHYKQMLAWVSFLAKEAPAVLRKVLPLVPVQQKYRGQWSADLVETVVATGRVALLYERLWAFQHVVMPLQKQKIWQWADDPIFATPRIARALMRMSCRVLDWAKGRDEDRGLSRKLLQSRAIVAAIDDIAPWLTTKMPDETVLGIARKTRSCPAAAAAFRATPRYQAIQCHRKFRATVYLTLFFRRHVSLAKARAATRGDCPICWAPKILQALHGDIRHGMCLSCMRGLQRKNMLDRCPMCRVSLREPEEAWTGSIEWHGEWH
jgi:hypothetical protein